MSHRHSISGPPVAGQLPVLRSRSPRLSHSSSKCSRYSSNSRRLELWSGPLVGGVRLVYIPKWIRVPSRCCRCQSGDPFSDSTRRSLDIWSFTKAFIG